MHSNGNFTKLINRGTSFMRTRFGLIADGACNQSNSLQFKQPEEIGTLIGFVEVNCFPSRFIHGDPWLHQRGFCWGLKVQQCVDVISCTAAISEIHFNQKTNVGTSYMTLDLSNEKQRNEMCRCVNSRS
jgi:hypothetical protein